MVDMKQLEDELAKRREERKRRRKVPPEEREAGLGSCGANGGKQRHGHPCLRDAKPQFGNRCWQHPAEGFEEAENPQPPRPYREFSVGDVKQGGQRWQVLQDMLDAEGTTLEEFVAQLSPEELARGQMKSSDGKFKGPPPKWVPRAFHTACLKELMRRGRELYQENYVDAIKVMLELAHNQEIEGNVRIKAAQFVIERIEGKTPEKIVIETKDSFSARVEELGAAMEEDEQLKRVKERLKTEGPTAITGT